MEIRRRNERGDFGAHKGTDSAEYAHDGTGADADISFAKMANRTGKGRKGHGTKTRAEGKMNGNAEYRRKDGNDAACTAASCEP